MKKIKSVIPVLLCLLLALTACDKVLPGPSAPEAPPVLSEAAKLVPESEGPVPEFLDEELQSLYARAKTAYMEFTYYNQGFGSSGEGKPDLDKNDMNYYKANGAITTWADFDAAMKALFTPEYADELNKLASYTDGSGVYHERTIFIDQDGDLYYSGGARGGRMTFVAPETFEILSETDTEIRFYVVGTYDDLAMDSEGSIVMDEKGDYVRAGNPVEERKPITLVKGEDGWRFSEFNLAF